MGAGGGGAGGDLLGEGGQQPGIALDGLPGALNPDVVDIADRCGVQVLGGEPGAAGAQRVPGVDGGCGLRRRRHRLLVGDGAGQQRGDPAAPDLGPAAHPPEEPDHEREDGGGHHQRLDGGLTRGVALVQVEQADDVVDELLAVDEGQPADHQVEQRAQQQRARRDTRVLGPGRVHRPVAVAVDAGCGLGARLVDPGGQVEREAPLRRDGGSPLDLRGPLPLCPVQFHRGPAPYAHPARSIPMPTVRRHARAQCSGAGALRSRSPRAGRAAHHAPVGLSRTMYCYRVAHARPHPAPVACKDRALPAP